MQYSSFINRRDKYNKNTITPPLKEMLIFANITKKSTISEAAMGAATFARLAHTIPNEMLADFKYSNEICYNVAHQQSHTPGDCATLSFNYFCNSTQSKSD